MCARCEESRKSQKSHSLLALMPRPLAAFCHVSLIMADDAFAVWRDALARVPEALQAKASKTKASAQLVELDRLVWRGPSCWALSLVQCCLLGAHGARLHAARAGDFIHDMYTTGPWRSFQMDSQGATRADNEQGTSTHEAARGCSAGG